MTRTAELKDRRWNLITEQTALLDKAKSEKRNSLTKEEEEKFGKLEMEVRAVDNEIRKEEARVEEEKREWSGQASASNGTSQWVDPRSGLKVPILRPEQRMADAVDHRLPDGLRAQDLDFGRWLKGIITNNWKGAEAEARAMNSASPTAGGVLVPTALSTQIIDLARAGSAAVRLGAGTIPMETPTLNFAAVSSDPAASWHAESATITPTDPGFAAVTLTAKTVAILTNASVELVEDGIGAGDVIQNTIAKSISGEMDRVAMYGNGVTEPGGIVSNNQCQTYSMGANGASMANFDPISESMVKILNYNGNATGCLYSPRTWKVIDQLKEATTNAPLQPPPSFQGLQKLVSSRVSITRTQGSNSTCSDIFVGDFSQLFFGIRTQLNLEVSRVAGSSFSNLTVAFRGYARLDVLIRQPKHFCTVIGVY